MDEPFSQREVPMSKISRSLPRARLARMAVLAVTCMLALTGLVTSSASAGAVKGSLAVISVNDAGTGLAGAVAARPMTVVVEARDLDGLPMVVNRDTGVRLGSTGGPGTLSGVVTGTIAKNTSRATITGALYSVFANGVTLTATATSGITLDPTSVTVNVAHSAVNVQANPHQALDVTDPGCPGPTPDMPVCGFLLLDNGGNGAVLMSVGSCDQILACRTSGGSTAELVTASVNLKDANGNPLYTRADPATLILACDKSLCGNGGVGKFPVTVDLTDTGAFTTLADCPAKGVLGADQDACVDPVQSTKDNAGDVYTYILFVHDIRGSYP
jgi:hypothetical protein